MEELIKQIHGLFNLSTIIPACTEDGRNAFLEHLIEKQIDNVKEAFQDYKNPPRTIIKGKLLKLESND
jgi:hypothetical protein